MKWFYIILYCTAYVLPMHGEPSAGVDFAHQQVGTIRIICIRPCCRRSLRNAITQRPLSYVCIGSTKPFYNPGRSLPGYVCGWFELRTRSANTIIMRDPVPEGLFFFLIFSSAHTTVMRRTYMRFVVVRRQLLHK